MVCKSRNSFADVLFKQGLVAFRLGAANRLVSGE